MKTYKDIYFTVNTDIKNVLSAMEGLLTNGWIRDEEADVRLKEISSGSDDASHYFHCDRRGNRWAATLILTRQSEGKYWLSHVLPIEDSPNPFSVEQFNKIADEFLENYLNPLEVQGSIVVLNFDGEIDLEVELGKELFSKLRSFSRAANKSTGSSHPSDRKRWFEFISSIAGSDRELSPPTLRRWLIEEDNWSSDSAYELSSEYEFGVDLLKHSKG